jgi:hypothetical protein
MIEKRNTMSVFERHERNDDYYRDIRYSVRGFGGFQSVSVKQGRTAPNGPWDEAKIAWGCGGQDGSVSSVEAARNQVAALQDAIAVCEEWNKLTQ